MVTRFICAFILHLDLHKEVLQALTFSKYMLNHTENFKVPGSKTETSLFPCVLVFLMQGFTALFTEVINILLILAA